MWSSTKAAAAARGVEVVVAPEDRARIGQRGDHQGVPGGEALVVEAGAHALRANGEQGRADARALLLGWLGPPRLEDVGALEVAALGRAEPRDRRVGVVAQRRAQLGHASRRRTCPPRLLSRRRARCRSRLRGRASRAAPSRASPQRSAAAARHRWPGSRAGTRVPAARCRRASSRSAARSSARRRCSARSRRRRGRRCRRRPSSAASAAPSAARRARAGTR